MFRCRCIFPTFSFNHSLLPLQGFSTGLPERLQLPLLRTLPGLENCSMLRPAYAVEYDCLPAHQCSRSLMTKKIDGLFFSGQINGTTGYEEAAAQVIIFLNIFFWWTIVRNMIWHSLSIYFDFLAENITCCGFCLGEEMVLCAWPCWYLRL